jgi:hypothetical protein
VALGHHRRQGERGDGPLPAPAGGEGVDHGVQPAQVRIRHPPPEVDGQGEQLPLGRLGGVPARQPPLGQIEREVRQPGVDQADGRPRQHPDVPLLGGECARGLDVARPAQVIERRALQPGRGPVVDE